jgi:hypothetical protein
MKNWQFVMHFAWLIAHMNTDCVCIKDRVLVLGIQGAEWINEDGF